MKKLKYTLLGQMLELLKAHAVIAAIFMILWLMLISFWETETGAVIFYVSGILCYAMSSYNAANSCLLRDKRPSSSMKPYPAKGLLLPAVLIAVNIIVVLLYKAAWTYGGDGEFLRNGMAVAINIFSIAWFSPYGQAAGMAKGVIELQGYILIFILPVAASAAGYFAGYRGIDLFEKISSIAYEKNNKKRQ